MASSIDITKPVAGSATTQSVRDNFAAAKNEIQALQQRYPHIGFIDYNDSATVLTPISLTANTWAKLTNNGNGANTLKTYKPQGVTELWNTSTNQFTWADLILGDMVEMRTDISITTTGANQTVWLSMFMGVGGSQYELPIVVAHLFKTAGTYQLTPCYQFYIGNATTLNNPAEIKVKSDATATCVVNGFYIKATLIGDH